MCFLSIIIVIVGMYGCCVEYDVIGGEIVCVCECVCEREICNQFNESFALHAQLSSIVVNQIKRS